jgi:hypothetical protein
MVLASLGLFLARTAAGYALVLAAFGPKVTQGSWPRVSLYTIAFLAACAIPSAAPLWPSVALAATALLVERARAFGVRGLRSTLAAAIPAAWLLWEADGTRLYGVAGGVAAGGTLGAMLLGHSYLTARGLSFDPLRWMARLLLGVLAARAAVAALLVARWWPQGRVDVADQAFLLARGAFGLALPLVFGWMALQCAKLRSNQSATGILYAMTALVGAGEMIAAFLTVSAGIPA